MPTNEERRIIADYLRESNKTEFTTAEIELCEVAACVRCDSVSKLKTRLADLIEPEPERTCRAEQDYDAMEDGIPDCRIWRCSCGEAFPYWRGGAPCYCPDCGAKIFE